MMKTLLIASLLGLSSVFGQVIRETNVTVQTFVGSGVRAVIDGQGLESAFYEIVSFNISSDDFLFATQDNGTLRRISPSAFVSSFQGPAYAYSVAATASNRALVSFNQNIYESIPALALWNGGTRGFQDSSNFVAGAYGAMLHLDFARDGTLWIADDENKRVRVIFPSGELKTVAGSGDRGLVDGKGQFTSFSLLSDIAVDSLGDAVVMDQGRIRKVFREGTVQTLAGGEQGYVDGETNIARLGLFPGVCVASNGDILIADRSNHSIRRMRGSRVTTVAGGNGAGFRDGAGDSAQFNIPDDIVEDSNGNLFVADAFNYRIRKISFNAKPEPVPDTELSLRMYPGVKFNGSVGRSYQIEATPDLQNKTNWTPIEIIILPNNPFIWFDEENPGPPNKFYRALLLP